MLSRIVNFLKIDIWRIRIKNSPKTQGWLIKQLRVVLIAIKGYREDKCQFRASALTFYTLLSIVPVLAMMFGIAKGFNFDEALTNYIVDQAKQQPQLQEVTEKIITFSNALLERTKGGAIAGIGIAILFMTVIKVLGNVENAFNFIWGVKKPRSLQRKFTDYLSVMIICPILIFISLSATVSGTFQIENIMAKLDLLPSVQSLIKLLLSYSPYMLLWLVFTFIFCFMPNTKVKLSSAILAGIVAGTIFQVTQFFYLKFQVGVTKYNEIYGSFAALPLFLVWLQLSWFIVLFGAEVSFAHQNVETFELEPDCLRASKRFRKNVAVLITNLVVKTFEKGQDPLSASDIGQKLDLPIRLIRELLHELTQANILSEVVIDDSKENGYHPARPTEDLTIIDVISAIEEKGLSKMDFAHSDKLDKISKAYENIQASSKSTPDNILVKDI